MSKQKGGNNLLKRILISQRVGLTKYNERQDMLDQSWIKFLKIINTIPIPLPNHRATTVKILKMIPPNGILLTGGNTPVMYGGSAPERDEIDILLIDYAISNNIPLIGVCRGMESIALYFGGNLKKINNHVNKTHLVNGFINRKVNSFHHFAINKLPKCLETLSCSQDKEIEAIKHSSKFIFGIMWHPERERKFSKEDIDFFHNIWNRNEYFV